ncbi:hypothetical protein V5O48_018143, partial [Marasmius crinis-equi]
IAAQNSRDRKKAHFSYLEQRVNELEEENKRLRASASLPPSTHTSTNGAGAGAGRSRTKEEEEAKEKENQELRARIVTLEQGLEAVVKAFTSQGTGVGVPSIGGSASTTTSGVDGSTLTTVPTTSTTTPASHPSTSTSTPPTTLTPSTDLSLSSIPTPSPFPSTSSLPLSAPFPSSSSSPSPSIHDLFNTPTAVAIEDTGGDHAKPSRVPAAGGLDDSLFSTGTDATGDDPTASAPLDDAAMEDLFREILHSVPDTAEGANAGTETESLSFTDLFEGAGGQGQGQDEGAAETTASTQVDRDGVPTEMEGLGFGDFDTSGISATWLDDYTTGLLEELVSSANAGLHDTTDTSSAAEIPTWESLVASGVGVL